MYNFCCLNTCERIDIRNNWIHINSKNFKYEKQQFHPLRIQFIIHLHEQHLNLKILDNEPPNTIIIKHFSEPIQSIINYNQYCKQFRSPKFQKNLLNSVTNLFKKKTTQPNCLVLCAVSQHCNYKPPFSNKWCHVFNVTAESLKFSIIHWQDCRHIKYINETIKLSQPVFFGNVCFYQKNKKWLFKITNDSWMIYNISPIISSYITGSVYGQRRLKNISYLWGVFYQMHNKLYYKSICMIEYTNFQTIKSKLSQQHGNHQEIYFRLNAQRICHFNTMDCNIRWWCFNCKRDNKIGNICACVPFIEPNHVSLDVNLMIKWNINTKRHDSNPYKDHFEYCCKVSLHALKDMFHYLHSRHSNLIPDCQWLTALFNNKTKLTYGDKEKIKYLESLVSAFMTTIIGNKVIEIMLLCEQKRQSNGRSITHLTITDIHYTIDHQMTVSDSNIQSGTDKIGTKRKFEHIGTEVLSNKKQRNH